MSLTFTIAGVDRTASVQVETLAVTDTLGSRNTCTFVLEDSTISHRPAIGSEVIVMDGATRVFAGTIDDFTEADLSPEVTTGAIYTIDAVDWNQLTDRFDVAKAYTAMSLRDIVDDIVNGGSLVGGLTLAAEGVTMTTATVPTGPTIEAAVWNYLPVSTAFQDLADLTGYSWWIDYNKVLWFQPRAGVAAPYGLTDTSGNFRKLTVKRSRQDYRNTQILRAGTDLAASRTDSWAGDGKSRAFPITYPVGAVPTAMKVNGVTKTIGVLNVDTGMDWYYQIGSNTITQDSSGTLLASTDTGAITYQGQYPIIVVAQNDGEVAARAAVEGGSGVYQETEYYPNLNSNASAQQFANGLLQKFATIPVIVDWETDDDGLFSGQLIPITNTKHGLAGSYLISKVSFGDFTGTGELRYQVEAYDGQFLGGWEAFFLKMANTGKQFVIRQNEQVVYLRTAGYTTGVGVNASESLAQNNQATAIGATASESMTVPSSFTPVNQTEIGYTNLMETSG